MSETKVGLLTAVVGLSSAAIGVIGTIVVGSFGYFNKDRELDIRMVDVSLSILRGEATGDKDTIQARRFALRLLRKYAEVDIPQGEFDSWAEKGKTPFATQARFGPKHVTCIVRLLESFDNNTNEGIGDMLEKMSPMEWAEASLRCNTPVAFPT